MQRELFSRVSLDQNPANYNCQSEVNIVRDSVETKTSSFKGEKTQKAMIDFDTSSRSQTSRVRQLTPTKKPSPQLHIQIRFRILTRYREMEGNTNAFFVMLIDSYKIMICKHTYTPFCIIAIAHSLWTLCEHGRIWQPLNASWK